MATATLVPPVRGTGGSGAGAARPGADTLQVSGADHTSGVALVERFELP